MHVAVVVVVAGIVVSPSGVVFVVVFMSDKCPIRVLTPL